MTSGGGGSANGDAPGSAEVWVEEETDLIDAVASKVRETRKMKDLLVEEQKMTKELEAAMESKDMDKMAALLMQARMKGIDNEQFKKAYIEYIEGFLQHWAIRSTWIRHCSGLARFASRK